jgi:chemotaxis protein methyltransferase CheR
MAFQFLNLNKQKSIGREASPVAKEVQQPNYNETITNEIENINDSEFMDLRNFIYKKCGIYFTDTQKNFLEGRIKKRLVINSIRSFKDYLNFIKSPKASAEINALLDIITINETYFFRAKQQYEALEKKILMELIESKGTNNEFINIWSAASSSGEEAYSLAMIINEKIRPKYPNLNIKIIGSDINRNVLETAKNGIYSEYSVKCIPEEYLSKYFKYENRKYYLCDEIKQMVEFTQLNLFDENDVKSMNYNDIIFCANTLIYFDLESRGKVVSLLYDSLCKGGYLFIGCAESLYGVSQEFKLIHFNNAIAYNKA